MKDYGKQKVGRIGEKLAARYLKKNGYRILHRNQRFGHNELDIVARSNTHVAFVEVKTRSFESEAEALDRPALAVNAEKRKRTVEAAFAYLKKHPTSLAPRFDVVEVYLDRSRRLKPFKINHITDAFHARGSLR
jgi:putative endonuclease